jgi:hypothetical protein
MAKMIVGLFENTRVAREALAYLEQNGYSKEDITVCIKTDNASDTAKGVVVAPALPYLLVDYSSKSPERLLERLLLARSLKMRRGNLLIAGRLAERMTEAAAYQSTCLEDWLARVGSDESKTPYYQYGLNQGQLIIMIRVKRGDEETMREMLQFWGRGLEICEEKGLARQPYLKQRPRRSTPTAV